MQRVNIGLVCLSWFVLASAVSAQTAVDPTSSAGIAAVQNYSGSTLLAGTYFDIRHVTGDGVGWYDSYSQIGAFTPFWINEDSFVAPNARLIITNSTQVGVNAGLVGRRYVEGLDRIFGVYSYYDSDQNNINNRYDQVTIGAETLGQWWDTRANGYITTGNSDNFVQALCVGGNPYFSGNQIAFLGSQLRDQSMSGADWEFGVPVHANAQWLRAYSGIYAYRTSQQNTFGYRGRVEAMVSNDLTLGVMVSEDRLWGTNVNATIDFKFSGFQPTRYFPNMTTRQRMLNPVQRNWRVATHTYTANVDVAAINPLTNQPYFVTHVDNSAAAGGDGTYLHPLNYLPNSATGDIILVHRGTSTELNPVRGSIALSDNQRLLGDGILSTVDLYARYGMCTVVGNYNLPGTSNSGLYPFVSNNIGSASPIVTLANNNEVAGLSLMRAGGDAITNTASGSHNFLLHSLEIYDNQGAGINLANASGVGIIRDINVGATNHANPNGFGQNAGGGIGISTGGVGLNLSMTNVNMNANSAKPQPFGIHLIADSASLNLAMNNVIANGNGSGIELTEHSQVLNANMNLVRANNNATTGIKLDGAGGIVNINMNNVAAMGNGSDNLQIGSPSAPITTSDVTINATDTNFSNSTGGSGVVFSLSAGVGTLNLIDSVVAGNAVDGLGVYGQNSTQMLANVQNGNFQGNGRDAFHAEGTSGATINLYVDPTNGSNSGRDGLYYRLDGNSVLNTVFLNDNLNHSGRSAIHGELTNQSMVNMYVNGTTGRDSGGDGFYINAAGGSVANLEINNGTLAGAGRLTAGSSAFNFISNNSTIGFLSDFVPGNNVAANGSVGTQAYGLSMNIANGSQFTGNLYNSNLSDSLINAVNATVTSGSNASLTLINTASNRSGVDGVVANVDYAILNTNFQNSGIGSSGRDGMSFNVTNGGILNSQFHNSSFQSNGRDGINGNVAGTTSVASISLLDSSTILNSGHHGIEFAVDAGQLNVAARGSSISFNGLGTNGPQGGVIGSGVFGVVNNSGLASLSFNNTAINNNLDNGVFVSTHTHGNVQARFNLSTVNNNGTTVTTAKGNDGIRLEVDGSINSILEVVNGTTVNRNGNDGISLLATNGANLTATLGTDISNSQYDRGVSILNNGIAPPPFSPTAAGVDIRSQSGAVVNLITDGATIGNTLQFGSQQSGLLFRASTGGQLNAAMTTTNLSKNGSNAINGTVTGSGSVANLSLINVNGDLSGTTGALLNVQNGGELNVNSSVNTTFSQSGGSGIIAQVDGTNSVANFELDLIQLTANGTVFGGQGFNGLATNGGTLNGCFDTATIVSNANQGIQLTAVNANSLINFNVAGASVDNNSSEGLLIRVEDQAVVNYRSLGSSYSGNGSNGALDGVSVTAIGNGPQDSATARLLFSSDQVNNNTGNGFSLSASNGATLTTSMVNGVSGSNNAGYGISTSATGTNTQFNLLMYGQNTFTGNGQGPISPLVFHGINQVVLDLSGTYNNSTADGIKVDVQDVTNALVAIKGPGSISGSTLNGINVIMKNVANGAVLIDRVTTINNSGQDGIHVAFDNVSNGAIGIEGPTTINGSGRDAVNIIVNNSNLVDGLTFATGSLTVLTTSDSLNSPLDGCLPAPVTVSLNDTGLVPTQGLIVSGITAQPSANDGISIALTDSSVQTINVANNIIVNANGTAANTGDGIHFNLKSTPVQNLILDGNQIGGVKLNGVNFDLDASPITNVTIINNSIGTVVGGGGTAVSDTLPIILPGFNANTLAPNDDGSTGLVPLGFNIDFFGSNYNSAYVNNNGNITFTGPLFTFTPFPLLSTAIPIIAPFFADVDTRSGNPVTYGTGNVAGHNAFGVNWIDVRHFSSSGGGNNGLPTNTFQLVMIDRSDIGAGDFDFEFNYQQIQWEAGIASGSDSQGLGGNSARAGWSNGSTASYEIAGSAVNGAFLDSGPAATSLIHNNLNSVNDGRYVFFVRGGVIGGPAPNGLDGIRLNATNGSTIGSLNVQSNEVANSGKNGIEMLIANSDVNNQSFANNNIHNNGGDGVRLVNPTTISNTINTSFTNNTISNNSGMGVNIALMAGAGQHLNAPFTLNTISSNTGGPGVNLQLADNRNFTGNFDTNAISGNSTQGVNFNMGVNGHVTSDFTNNIINGNGQEGINIGLKTGGQYTGTNFYGNTIGTTTARNGGMGVRLTSPDQSSFVWNIGDSTKTANLITGNADAGVGIDMTGSANGTLHVQNTTFGNTVNGADVNFNGDGLAIHMNNTATLNDSVIGKVNAVNSIATNDTTFSNNAANGLSINAQGNSTLQNTFITNINATGNTGDGINIFRIGNPIFDNTTIQNSQFRTNANGINLIASNALRVDEYNILNNQIVSNRNDGLRMDVRFDAQIAADVTKNLIDSNGADGIHLVEQNNASSDNRFISGTWSLNTITNNAGNGIEITARSNINIGASTTQVDNLITGNGQNGILINGVNGSETTTIQGKVIQRNGTNGIVVNATSNTVTIDTNLITNNVGDGIDLFGRNGARLVASVDNNTIRFNQGDGMKINSSGQRDSGQTFNVSVGVNNPNGNDVSDNGLHGITILNQADGNATVTIANNAINRNGLEGVYVVNTASSTQTQNNTVNVNADGNVFDDSQMKFVFQNNSVLDNGHLATGANFSDVTGLYVRVGTNGASTNVADAGGFASNASTVNSVASASLTGRGGVLALVSDNIFGGNAGHDVGFDSFRSTVDPTTGAPANWQDSNDVDPTNDVFDPTGYQTDPLARLDLQFIRNAGEDADVTRSGAFYQSVDPVWKSRIGTDVTVASPPGPFADGGARERNAQRLASRQPPFAAPFSFLGASFLYPGVGSSTFRSSSDSDFNNVGNLNTNTFLTHDNFTSQVGLGVLFGELPFNWTTNLAP
jgi:hypothetical protein